MKTETLAIARRPLGRERLRRMVDDGVEGIRAIVMVPFDDVVAARGWEVVSALVENAAIEAMCHTSRARVLADRAPDGTRWHRIDHVRAQNAIRDGLTLRTGNGTRSRTKACEDASRFFRFSQKRVAQSDLR